LLGWSTKNYKLKTKNSSKGFTLVETVLALLAIGVGLVALFGLGRLGLEASRESDNDRRCAMMADAIFETLRAVNEVYINEARTNGLIAAETDDGDNATFSLQWDELWNQYPFMPPPNLVLWDSEGHILFPPVVGMSTNTVLVFSREAINWGGGIETYVSYDVNNISLANWNPRYYLNIRNLDQYGEYGYSQIAGSCNIKQVTLMIFPDGLTGSSDPRIFTTTLSNSGGMQ